MDFIDEVSIWIQGGKGGDGCISFRREKYVPKGGPDGGDGGDGGAVVLKVAVNVTTLTHLKHRKRFRAGNGEGGKGKKMNGKNGKDIVIQVPIGTCVQDEEKQQCLGDLTQTEEVLIGARGGRGGRGNVHFKSATFQTPDIAEKGKPGETRLIKLELKLLADVGLVGFPNVGKSTLLSVVSKARPKIADYPFTTINPNLGIVTANNEHTFIMADIPGLIEGAHHGKGLGDRFLRHIERTRVLVFIIESTAEFPENDFRALIQELELYEPGLLRKPRIVMLSKVDLLSPAIKADLPVKICGETYFPVSSVTGEGIPEFLDAVVGKLGETAYG